MNFHTVLGTPQQGIQYFVPGAGGKVRRRDVHPNSPLTAKSFDSDNRYMQVEIDHWQISFLAISESGLVIDSGIIR